MITYRNEGDSLFIYHGDHITLGQFLKAHLALSGGEAKHLLSSGGVLVNGEVDIRRGRKLRQGDTVRLGRQCWQMQAYSSQV
ncbi:MAG: RNA-binding S4 domain-containing protein [Symbiobacteriaceae bacterium]|nr:RNA-binding S4 domain-containing protein [Symbiobacteriaceae bacterium]